MAVRHRAHHGLQGDPGANHHLSRANWIVFATLLGQTVARIDFEGHFIALPPHGGGGGVQAARGSGREGEVLSGSNRVRPSRVKQSRVVFGGGEAHNIVVHSRRG